MHGIDREIFGTCEESGDYPYEDTCTRDLETPEDTVGTEVAEDPPMSARTQRTHTYILGACMCITLGTVVISNLTPPQVIVIQKPTHPAAVVIPKPVAVQRTPEPTPHREVGVRTHNVITSGFGIRTHPMRQGRYFHHGADVRAPEGTPVYAPEVSVVDSRTFTERGGICLTLRHAGAGRSTKMCHLKGTFVTKDAYVPEGTLIALTGKTGSVTAPHLHLEHTENGRRVDPAYIVDKVLR